MPLFYHRVTFEASTADSADRCIWTYGYSKPSSDDFLGLVTVWDALWEDGALGGNAGASTLRAQIHNGYIPLYHELFPAEGGAALDIIDADPALLAGNALERPTEVQICVSRLVSTPRGMSPVGRIYMGPVGGAMGARVSDNQIQVMVQHNRKLHEQAALAGWDPQVIAKGGTALAAGKPIAGYRADDLWDIQRRRGFEQNTPASTVTATPA